MRLDLFLRWLEEHDKLAGWAQFAGGALAIIAAFMVAAGERRAERRDHDRAQRALEGAAVWAVIGLRAKLQTLVAVFKDPEDWQNIVDHGYMPDELVEALVFLDGLPLHELDDGEVGFLLRRIRLSAKSLMRLLPSAVEILRLDGKLEADDFIGMDEALASIRDHSTEMTSKIDEARMRRAGRLSRMWVFVLEMVAVKRGKVPLLG